MLLGLVFLSGQLASISHEIVGGHEHGHAHEEAAHTSSEDSSEISHGFAVLPTSAVGPSEAEFPDAGSACLLCQLGASVAANAAFRDEGDSSPAREALGWPTRHERADSVYRFAPKTSPPVA